MSSLEEVYAVIKESKLETILEIDDQKLRSIFVDFFKQGNISELTLNASLMVIKILGDLFYRFSPEFVSEIKNDPKKAINFWSLGFIREGKTIWLFDILTGTNFYISPDNQFLILQTESSGEIQYLLYLKKSISSVEIKKKKKKFPFFR